MAGRVPYRLQAACALALWGVVATWAEEPLPSYDVYDLGHLGGGTSMAYGVNDRGHVVGGSITTTGVEHAFLWTGATMQDLGVLPGGISSTAYAINNRGQVVGESNTNGYMNAFHYVDGVMSNLGTLGGPSSSARAINELGDIAGYSPWSAANIFRAVLWTNGTAVDLGVVGWWKQGSTGWGINDARQVVGISHTWAPPSYRPFIWEDLNHSGVNDQFEMWVVDTLGGTHGICHDINNLGQMVGHAETSNATQNIFLITPRNGKWLDGRADAYNEYMVDLGTLPGGATGTAWAINDAGVLVGESEIGDGSLRAVISQGAGLVDLNDLIDPLSGWVLSSARDINNATQVVGYGINPAGQVRGFLLTPRDMRVGMTRILREHPLARTNELLMVWTGHGEGMTYTIEYSQDGPDGAWHDLDPADGWPDGRSFWEGPVTSLNERALFRVRGIGGPSS